MKEYKGFSIPEFKEELSALDWNPGMPTIVVTKDDGTRLNVQVSIEEANSLPFDKIDEMIRSTIDTFVES